MADNVHIAGKLGIEEMAVFCKAKGFVYPSAELYGGLAGFFDFGPLGVEVTNNIKQHWWKTFVQSRDDMVGLDGSIVTNPKVWKASGHVDCFEDVMVECKKCHARVRGDHLLEDALKVQADGLSRDAITKLIIDNKVKCPECKGELGEGRQFNLMFSTNVGPAADESTKTYLRPETAQLIFADFKLITDTTRLKLPFGIAQIGKAFRNEIAPRDFLFRCREFEQMEIEYFIHPKQINECPHLPDVFNHHVLVFSSDMQEKNQQPKEMSMKETLDAGIVKTQWHAYWLAKMHQWFISLGATANKFRIRQHLPTEKSHYALDTWDLEYEFPFGWKELQGMANRTDFDLQQHMKHAKKDLSLYDEESKQKVVPHVVAEPSQGVGRAFLVFMFDAYHDDKERGNIVLRLNPLLAPTKVSVLPLINKEGLPELAQEIYRDLKKDFTTSYDKSGSIGRRYARNDEMGTPFCVTIDFDSLKLKDVTIRDRDTTLQKRVKIKDVKGTIRRLVNGEIAFKDV